MLANRSGAELVIAAGQSAPEQVREATHGLGADVVLDFVGSEETLRLAAQSARMMADLTIVGLGGGTLPVSFFGIPYEVSVQTTYWGNRAELVEVLDLAARGHLHAEITPFELDQAEQAYEQLRSGAVDGRVVVVPNGA